LLRILQRSVERSPNAKLSVWLAGRLAAANWLFDRTRVLLRAEHGHNGSCGGNSEDLHRHVAVGRQIRRFGNHYSHRDRPIGSSAEIQVVRQVDSALSSARFDPELLLDGFLFQLLDLSRQLFGLIVKTAQAFGQRWSVFLARRHGGRRGRRRSGRRWRWC
jgi:hypothetical protein